MAASNKIQVGYIEAQDGAQFEVDAGTASAPGLCFDDSAATGLYSPGTGQIAWSTSGKQTALRILADGKVGVDCSPTVALEVNGTIKASAIDAPIEGTLDDWIVHAGDTNTKFGFPAADVFTTETGGSERLRCDSDGVKVHNGRFYSAGTFAYIESSSTSSSTLTLKKSASGADSIDYLQCRNNANGLLLKIGGDGTIYSSDVLASHEGDTDTKIRFPAADTIQFETAGSPRLLITSDGKVGIGGATSPEELLDLGNALQINLKVGGRAYLGQGYSTAATILGHSVKAKTTGTVSGGMEVTETNSGGGAPSAMRMQSGNIEFHTAGSGTSGATFDSEKLRITSGGKILTGTSSSRNIAGGYAKLQVEAASSEGISLTRTTNDAGAAYFSFGKIRTGGSNSGRCVEDDNIGAISWNPSDGTDLNHAAAEIQCLVAAGIGGNDVPGNLIFKTNSGTTTTTERLRIDSNGKLILSNSEGIQLSAKTSTLYTSDGSISYYATNNAVYINGAGASGWLRLSAAGTANNRTAINLYGHSYSSSDQIDFRTNSLERLRIDSSGHLKHIGLRSGNSENKLALLTAPSYNTSEEDVIIYQVENESGFNQLSIGGGTGSLNAMTALSFRTASAVNTTGGTERLRITSDGEIRCTGAADNKGFAVYLDSTRRVAELIEHSSDGELRLYTGESTPVLRSVITAYGNSYINAAGTGRFGVGTTSPDHIFEVESNNSSIAVSRTGSNAQLLFKSNSVGQAGQIQVSESSGGGVMLFYNKTTSGTLTENLRIGTDGTTEFAAKKWRVNASNGQLEEYPYNTSTSSFSSSTSNGYHLARVRNGQVPTGTSGNTYTLINTNTIGEAGAYIIVLRSFEQAQTGGVLWSVRVVTSVFYLHSGSGNDGETVDIPVTYSGHANNATTQAGNGHGPVTLKIHFYGGSAHTHGRISITFNGFNYTGTNCDYYVYKLIDI